MNLELSGPAQPPIVNFSAAIGLAERAHATALNVSGSDVFSLLKLNRASLARELPSLASAPSPAPGYSSTPTWKVWQDF